MMPVKGRLFLFESVVNAGARSTTTILQTQYPDLNFSPLVVVRGSHDE